MKSNKHSKRNFKYPDIEKSSFGSQSGKSIRKDRSSKRRLSIYDEFEDDSFDELKFSKDEDDLYDEE